MRQQSGHQSGQVTSRHTLRKASLVPIRSQLRKHKAFGRRIGHRKTERLGLIALCKQWKFLSLTVRNILVNEFIHDQDEINISG